MKAQIGMMAVAGREAITATTAAALLEAGASDLDDRTIVYVAPTGRPAPVVPGWRLERRELGSSHVDSLVTSMRFRGHGSNPWLDFAHLLLSADPARDLIFFEDDVQPCRNAVRAMAAATAPADAGVLSFFDFRNEWPRVGVHRAPSDRELHGAQALKFPAGALLALQGLARRGTDMRCWDVWISRAVAALGLGVYHYAPSLVQHVGQWSMYAPGTHRETARNYPGDDFDALGPCADPIVEGPTRAAAPVVCPMHNEIHEGGASCAITR